MRPYCSTSTLALYQERRSSLLYPRSLVEEPALFLSKLVPSPRHLRLLARAAVGGAVFSSSPHFGPDPVFNFLRQGTSSPSKKNYKYRSEGQGRRWSLGDVFECRTNHLAASMIWAKVCCMKNNHFGRVGFVYCSMNRLIIHFFKISIPPNIASYSIHPFLPIILVQNS